MAVSYKKLWKLLIDKDTKKGLYAKTCSSQVSITKMSQNGHVTTEILPKTVRHWIVKLDDIVEIIPSKAP